LVREKTRPGKWNVSNLANLARDVFSARFQRILALRRGALRTRANRVGIHPAKPRQNFGALSGIAGPRIRLPNSRNSRRGVAMARVCQVTGKGPITGNNVSHANNKTKRRFLPNLQYRRFWVESENRWVRLRVSTNALRTIDKNGIEAVLADLRARGEAV